MTAHDDLAEDERVIDGATAGPWLLEPTSSGGSLVVRGGGVHGAHPQTHVQIVPTEDAAFIARARSRYPALVQEVRELRRAAYVLAMAVLQSDLYQEADDELRNAVSLATARHEEGA